MDRRAFLTAGAGAAALLLAGCSGRVEWDFQSKGAGAPHVTSTPSPSSSPTPNPTNVSIPLQGPPQLTKVALPSGGITKLPGTGPLMAWTVDDGTDAEVIRKYAEFAAATGTRITFFPNGDNPGWTEHAALLRPLVASGQIQIGNHTWDHPNLTKLSDSQVVAELQRNHDFILTTYGVDARPYFRPPYGFLNARVRGLAASIGYTTPVLWYGTLSDSGLITPDQVVSFATQWFLPGHIVLGHANHLPVTTVFPQLSAIIQERGLQTVTLRDMFL